MSPVERYRLPTSRPLRVFAFDPSAARRLNNTMTVLVPYEKLDPGPVGKQLAVIDYDASNELFYEAVDLDNPAVLIRNGLDPSESDPRFHQQMVYAIASETIRRFEFALGRSVRWRTKPGSRRAEPFHARLRIFPHAFQQANAFYDPQLRAVLFGYFPAEADTQGQLLPGQTVFTCLSHDIIAHEMTHAIIDGQREYLTDATGPDAAAFHEAFADIVALFQHFASPDALLDTIYRTGGSIFRKQLNTEAPREGDQATITAELTENNPLVELAQEFGHATGSRDALRSAIGTPPNSKAIETVTEAHDRGAILVSAVFDAFFSVYLKRTDDLMRIARAGGAVSPAGDLHPDLARRLSNEASKIAGNFANICIRALDYLPPVDLRFGEFLRAIITADGDLVPDDPHGYRDALIKAFRLRGIIPQGVRSYSEESLRWPDPELMGQSLERCAGLDYSRRTGQESEDADETGRREQANAVLLNAYAVRNAQALGLDPALPIQAYSHHPIHRISPSGRLVVDFVVQYLQKRDELLDPDVPGSPKITFRGGSTVIFDEFGAVQYIIAKSINDPDRLRQQRGYVEHASETAFAPYEPDRIEQKLNFQLIHSDARHRRKG